MADLFSRLKSYLNSSGLNTPGPKSNNALYQTILGLINGSRKLEVDSISIQETIAGGIPEPSNTVEALDGTGNAGTEKRYSRGDHKHADSNRPSNGEKAALVGTNGTPGSGNKYVTDSDGRLPTTDQKAALAGSFGTPSATNKYVTEDDTRFDRQWSVLTNGDLTTPELIFASGDVIMTHIP